MSTPEAIAADFFYKHAGWSYDPATETPEQGRRQTAERLAKAEAWAQQVGLEYRWEDDWSVDHQAEYDCYEDGDPETCESVTAWLGKEVVASLGCVDGASDEYRRVVEAELALEAKAVAS